MARIKLGPVVTDIAGSIGGMTIQRNKFGLTMRSKPLPLFSQTSSQYVIRQYIRSLQNSWQSLSDAQRLQWNRFLDFSGQTIRRDRSILMSGHTLYIKYQLFRLLAGQSLLTTLAYSVLPDLELFDEIKIVGGEPILYFEAGIDHAAYFFQFLCTTPRSPSKVFSRRGLRFMQVPWQSSGNYNFNDSYIAAFGIAPSTGDTVHYSLQYWSVVAPVFSSKYTGTIVCTAL